MVTKFLTTTKLLVILVNFLFIQSIGSNKKLPEKPLLTEIAAYNLNNINKLQLGYGKEKVLEIMGGNRIIKGYLSKDWKDYLTGLETKDIPNPYKIDLFVNSKDNNITILWYYTFPSEAKKLIPLEFKDNILIRVGKDNNR